MLKKITIRDIAKEAGVSVATVSFVMNNESGHGSDKYRVSHKTTEKILKIADKLNYKPNNAAQSLRSGRSNTIGVIVSDISNKFFADIGRCIEDVAYQSNYTVFFGSTDENPEKLDNIVNVLIARGIDGLIIVPCENSTESIKRVVDAGIPLVLLDRAIDGIEADSVTLNNRRATAIAAEHLVSQGAQKVEMISYALNVRNIKDREAGYCSVMAEAGLGENTKVHRIKFRNIPGQMAKVIEDVIARKVDAVMFATNTLSVEGMKCLCAADPVSLCGIKVAGFDESDAFDLCSYKIPYVKQPIELFGTESVRILLDSINNRKEQVVSVALSPQLVK